MRGSGGEIPEGSSSLDRTSVKEEPIHSGLGDCGRRFLEIDRFHNMPIRRRIISFRPKHPGFFSERLPGDTVCE